MNKSLDDIFKEFSDDNIVDEITHNLHDFQKEYRENGDDPLVRKSIKWRYAKTIVDAVIAFQREKLKSSLRTLLASHEDRGEIKMLDHDHWGLMKANNGFCPLCNLEEPHPSPEPKDERFCP